MVLCLFTLLLTAHCARPEEDPCELYAGVPCPGVNVTLKSRADEWLVIGGNSDSPPWDALKPSGSLVRSWATERDAGEEQLANRVAQIEAYQLVGTPPANPFRRDSYSRGALLFCGSFTFRELKLLDWVVAITPGVVECSPLLPVR
jgi:hypothetical protein